VLLNLIFYITSSLNKEEINKYIDEIILYIKRNEILDLDEVTVSDFKKCILDYPTIQFDVDDNGVEQNII
jgi:hypothetical protein